MIINAKRQQIISALKSAGILEYVSIYPKVEGYDVRQHSAPSNRTDEEALSRLFAGCQAEDFMAISLYELRRRLTYEIFVDEGPVSGVLSRYYSLDRAVNRAKRSTDGRYTIYDGPASAVASGKGEA